MYKTKISKTLALALLPTIIFVTKSFAIYTEVGNCSYHTLTLSKHRDRTFDFKLVSSSKCIKTHYNGTGFWTQTYEWTNGNSFGLVSESGGKANIINNSPIATEMTFEGSNEVCWDSKSGEHFDASCYYPN